MIRKTLTILSLIGLLLSVGLWAKTHHWNAAHVTPIPSFEDQYIVLPYYLYTLLFIVLPLSFPLWTFRRRRKRKKLGLCVKCGYDLRASKDRCPECGEAMQKMEPLGTMADGHDEPDYT